MKSSSTITTGQIYLWDDILLSGLDAERFLKKCSFQSFDLNNCLECHEFTYFPNITFKHFPNTNKFRVEENNFNLEKVERLIQIRDLEWEITTLENRIWISRVEGNAFNLLIDEANLIKLKSQLLDLLNYRKFKQCA